MDAPEGADGRTPSVIAAHVGITYRVYGAGRGPEPDAEVNPLKALLQRSTQHVGVREVEAVKDVSFVAYRGESIGIIGRNGSGKSTLLRTVAGLVPPTSGEIYLGGRAALLGVNAALIRRLSGSRNINIGAQALGLTPGQVRERYDDIVEFSGIGDFIDLPMNAYSSGMGARLAFAISTAVVPDILVVDEALATGDAEFKARANKRLREIREQAGTIFMVSHSGGTIRQLCDRALWMDRGHLVMDGPSEEVVGAYNDKYSPAARKRAAAARKAGKRSDKTGAGPADGTKGTGPAEAGRPDTGTSSA